MIKAGVLCTGTELLYGEVLNTNGQFFSETLSENGIETKLHISCGDNLDDLVLSLQHFFEYDVNLIIINGGLGPTEDDLTRKAVSQFAEKSLIQSEIIKTKLEKFFFERNATLSPSQLMQSYLPQGAIPLENLEGSADGWFLELENYCIVALPGPPHECRPIFKNFLNRFLLLHDLPNYFQGFYRIMASEGILNDIFKEKLGSDFSQLRYTAHYPYVDLKFKTNEKKKFETQNQQILQILSSMPHWYESITAVENLRQYLKAQNLSFTFSTPNDFFCCYFSTQLRLPDLFVSNTEESSEKTQLAIYLSGFESFWKQISTVQYEINLSIKYQKKDRSTKITINAATRDPLLYASELCAHNIIKFIQTI